MNSIIEGELPNKKNVVQCESSANNAELCENVSESVNSTRQSKPVFKKTSDKLKEKKT